VIRQVVFAFLCVALTVLAAPAAQDPPGDQPEPPVRLKKKARPEQPPDDKPAERAKDKDAKEAKDDPPIDPEKEAKEILARINKNLESARERLKKEDPGDVTQQHQRDVVKDLEALIDQMKKQQQQQQQQQAGGGGGGGSSKGGASGGGSSGQRGSRSARGQKRGDSRQGKSDQLTKGGSQSKQGNQPKGNQGGKQSGGTEGGMGGNSPIGADKLADLYKDIWGHLPESMRQEIDAYQKEGYMTKYRELLKQYYATIAEKGRKMDERERRMGEGDR
jgi:hypothetical protein